MQPAQTSQVRPLGHDFETDGLMHVELGALDFTAPREYVDMILAFKVEESSSVAPIISQLEASLSKSLGQYRAMAGRLCIDEDNKCPWVAVRNSDSVNFVVQDVQGAVPPFDELEQALFAQELFDPDLLLPAAGRYSAAPVPGDEAGLPISQFQVNLIQGGLLLVVTWHHTVTDVAGIYSFLKQWAANSRGGPTENGVKTDVFNSLDRSVLRSSGKVYRGRMEELTAKLAGRHFNRVSKNGINPILEERKSSPVKPIILQFPRDKCEELKSKASWPDNIDRTSSPPPRASSVSAHDAVLALLFQASVRAHHVVSRGGTDEGTHLTVAVDTRQRLRPPLPERYLGNAAYHAKTKKMAARELLDGDSLPRVAELVRHAVDEASDGKVKELVEWIGGIENKGRLSVSVGGSGMDFGARSWRDVRVYEEDFGFGRPRAVRLGRPSMDRLVVFYPPRIGGDEDDEGVEVLVCLEEKSMRSFLDDGELRRYAEM